MSGSIQYGVYELLRRLVLVLKYVVPDHDGCSVDLAGLGLASNFPISLSSHGPNVEVTRVDGDYILRWLANVARMVPPC